MKKYILITALAILSCGFLNAQIIDAVRGTIVSNAADQITVYAKSSVAITDKHTDNVVVSVSIADPGAGNRPNLSILTNHLPDVAWIPAGGSPYLEGGRYHYDFIANNTINTPGVSTITWIANQAYPLITLGFSNSNGFPTVRLDHWDSPNFGATSFSQWYFQIQQLGGGDITAQSNVFFGTATVVNDPGGWNSGTSFAPLQPLSVIPVKFVSFTATKNNNDAVLAWKVDNEDNRTDKYEVERSVNAVDFTKIATVAAKANGQASNSYELTDANLAALIQNANGVIYYRIKQLDKDGRFVYTEIRNIRLSGKGGFSAAVFPNPVKDVATLNVDLSVAADVLVYITDAAGKEVQKLTINGAVGGNTKRINMSNFAKGTYVMKVTTGTEVKTLTVVKGQ
jgi:Secretion system C-terminal sorting domain